MTSVDVISSTDMESANEINGEDPKFQISYIC